MSDASPPQSASSLEDEALEWVVRLHTGHTSDRDRRACEAWQCLSPAHQVAFHKAEALWKEIGHIGAGQRAPTHATRPARRQHHRWWPRLRPWSLVACLLLTAGWFLWAPLLDQYRLQTAHYRTGVGQQEQIVLQDGTRIILNTESALNVVYSPERREIHLLAGEAAFTVTADRERPFIVHSGDIITQALGTQFVVRRQPYSVTVTVSEHAVQVSTSPTGHRKPLVLNEGQQASYSEERGWSPPHAIDANQLSAWQRGKLIVEGQALGSVIEELNRYRPGRILILNPALRSLNVTGVFDLTDPDAALRMIERTLHIHETSLSHYLVLLH
jgi:transmembrane sensor